MIASLAIRNFKRFRALDLTLRNLTVFTGLNGMGKSTAIQALLLGRQVADDPYTSVVQLNGPYALALGDGYDVLHFDAEGSEVEIAFDCGGGRFEYQFHVPNERYPYLRLANPPADTPAELTGVGPAFAYLTAERLGPRDLLSVTSADTASIGVGEQGQYTAQVLAQYETQPVRAALLHPDTSRDGVTTLRTQAEKWASHIISPIQISAQWPPGLHTSVLRFQRPGLMSNPMRPANVGQWGTGDRRNPQ